MSDAIKHECGIALMRLRKPLSYYIEKYGMNYAMKKIYILMEKQHNRGQDGAGIANIKIDQKPGLRYISRYRSTKSQPIEDIFKKIEKKYKKGIAKSTKENHTDATWLKENIAFTGELWLGHLRYSTHGANQIENIHPFLRQNNWKSRNLVMAGNFNMTNVNELFDILIDLGQHPKEKVDTVTVMEKIGHFLDEEVQRLFKRYKNKYKKIEISNIIEQEIDLQSILKKACKDFDGGYTIAGLTGSGSAFVVRDPVGIRPAYYYANEEVVVVASEKPTIKTAFNIDYEHIKEITPGNALIIAKNGSFAEFPIMRRLEKKSCSFERIYFSRSTDPEIYRERKLLGKLLAPAVLRSINYNLNDTIFSYVPNTAEIAMIGMIDGIEEIMKNKFDKTTNKTNSTTFGFIRPRIEKIVTKDNNLRTFITNDNDRDDLVAHIYDTTYEVVRKGKDTLVIVDDSIVRGTTLEKSILKMLDCLHPKKIIIVSSSPQIRFPDCYGIDMSRMKDFVAFRAVIALIKESGQESILEEVYQQCLSAKQESRPKNYVKRLYQLFSYERISAKIAHMISSQEIKAELEIIFQPVENLRKAISEHRGDWYFSGNYPTKGGTRVVNQSYINYIENKKERAY